MPATPPSPAFIKAAPMNLATSAKELQKSQFRQDNARFWLFSDDLGSYNYVRTDHIITCRRAQLFARGFRRAIVQMDLIVRGGTVIDGTGAPRRKADIAIRDGRIVAIGDVSALAAD